MPPISALTAIPAMPALTVMAAKSVSFGFPSPASAMIRGLPGLTGSGVALAFLVLLVIAVIWRALYEPGALEVTRRTLVASEHNPVHKDPTHGDTTHGDPTHGDPAVWSSESAVQNLSRVEMASVRVALFSDLHADSLRIRPDELIRPIRQAGVDALIFLGDLASDDAQAKLAAPFLSELADFARGARIPFFSVPGNHDGPEARHILDTLGISLLENQQILFTTSSSVEVLVTGLADLRSGHPDPALLNGRADHPIRIVLAHNPDTVLDLPERGADFFLSGHFHWGPDLCTSSA